MDLLLTLNYFLQCRTAFKMTVKRFATELQSQFIYSTVAQYKSMT